MFFLQKPVMVQISNIKIQKQATCISKSANTKPSILDYPLKPWQIINVVLWFFFFFLFFPKSILQGRVTSMDNGCFGCKAPGCTTKVEEKLCGCTSCTVTVLDRNNMVFEMHTIILMTTIFMHHVIYMVPQQRMLWYYHSPKTWYCHGTTM